MLKRYPFYGNNDGKIFVGIIIGNMDIIERERERKRERGREGGPLVFHQSRPEREQCLWYDLIEPQCQLCGPAILPPPPHDLCR